MKDTDISEYDIHRYIDGEMSVKEADRISACAANDPKLALRIEQYRRINYSLHLGFDPILSEAIPQTLLQSVSKASYWSLYAIAATLVLGIFIGYLGRGLQPVEFRQPLTQVALSSHTVFTAEGRHAVEVKASEAAHLNAWLSKRLHAAVIAPDLTEFGLSLVGGRLLPDAGKPAAQFMYENQAGNRFTLYIRNSEQKNVEEFQLHYQPSQGLGVTYWKQGDLSYALTGDDNSEYLRELAIGAQLSTAPKLSL